MSSAPLHIENTDTPEQDHRFDGFDERTLSPVTLVDGWPVDQAGRFVPTDRWLQEFAEGTDAR